MNQHEQEQSEHLVVILRLQEAKHDEASECQRHTKTPIQKLLHLDGWPGTLPPPLVHQVEQLWTEGTAEVKKARTKQVSYILHTVWQHSG